MSMDVSKNGAKITIGEDSYAVDLLKGPEDELAIDTTKFRSQSGVICMDPGFGNTGSCTSAITFLDGEKGLIRHRGYRLQDLADNCSYLDVAYLLMVGDLPNTREKGKFENLAADNAFLGPSLKELLNHYPPHAHPMAVLASAVLSLGSFYPDLGKEKYYELDMDVVRLVAKTPSIAAHTYRRRRGLDFINPVPELSYTENFLNMLYGDRLSPERREIMARALDKLLIIHADHEQNCSTSTVRVISSSGANVYAAISGGISALWGPLHGGANEAVINMLEFINNRNNDIDEVVKKAKDKEDPFRLMGFGHRVYKTYDPRAKIAKSVVDSLLQDLGFDEPLVDVAMKLEKVAIEDPYFVDRNLYPNVDFYTGIAYKAMGIPKSLFTVLFAMGRMSGWLAHLLEATSDPARRISRPRQIYVGETERDIVPVEQR